MFPAKRRVFLSIQNAYNQFVSVRGAFPGTGLTAKIFFLIFFGIIKYTEKWYISSILKCRN